MKPFEARFPTAAPGVADMDAREKCNAPNADEAANSLFRVRGRASRGNRPHRGEMSRCAGCAGLVDMAWTSRLLLATLLGSEPTTSIEAETASGCSGAWFRNNAIGRNVVKLTLRDRETAQEAVRRFRKLVERSGIKKEMRVREFYEKPSETKRRARLRAQRRARRDRLAPLGG